MTVEIQQEFLREQVKVLLPKISSLHAQVKKGVDTTHRDSFIDLECRWWELENLKTILQPRCRIPNETCNVLSRERTMLDEILCTLHTSRT